MILDGCDLNNQVGYIPDAGGFIWIFPAGVVVNEAGEVRKAKLTDGWVSHAKHRLVGQRLADELKRRDWRPWRHVHRFTLDTTLLM